MMLSLPLLFREPQVPVNYHRYRKKVIILQVSCLDIKGYDSYFFTFLTNEGPFVSPKKLVSFSRYSFSQDNFSSQTFFLWKNETIVTLPYILHKLTNAIFWYNSQTTLNQKIKFRQVINLRVKNISEHILKQRTGNQFQAPFVFLLMVPM